MKTSEFIRKVEDMGYPFERYQRYIFIKDDLGEDIATIDTQIKFGLRISHNNIPSEPLFDLFVEYVKTPIGEREDEKLYKVEIPMKGTEVRYFIFRNVDNNLKIISGYDPIEQSSTPHLYYNTEKLIKEQCPWAWKFAEEVME